MAAITARSAKKSVSYHDLYNLSTADLLFDEKKKKRRPASKSLGRCSQWFDHHGVHILNTEIFVPWRRGCMDTWYLSKITRTGEEKMSEIRVVSGEIAFMPHVEINHLLLLLIIVLYPKMITVYRIWEMVSFELGEEIEKDVFRLVISVGQRENLSLFLYWFQNLPSLLFYLQTWRYRHCWS